MYILANMPNLSLGRVDASQVRVDCLADIEGQDGDLDFRNLTSSSSSSSRKSANALSGNALSGSSLTGNSVSRDLSHSELAMKAAKGMRRSIQKEKTGRVVCGHLLQMLAEENIGCHFSRQFRRAFAGPVESKNDRQYLLSF